MQYVAIAVRWFGMGFDRQQRALEPVYHYVGVGRLDGFTGAAENKWYAADMAAAFALGTIEGYGGGGVFFDNDYEQIDGINMTGVTFTPVGGDSNSFAGYYGGGKTIGNLTIINTRESFQGTFGWVAASGMVKNLGLENIVVTGAGNAGGAAGTNDGMVQNRYATGSVKRHWCIQR